MDTTKAALYNKHYAQYVRAVSTRRTCDEPLLIAAHFAAHTIVFGTKTRSPFDTTQRAAIERPAPMVCDQCGNETSWTTNEFARTATALICRSCNDSNKADSSICPGPGPEFYPDENQWMPCDVCGGDCSVESIKANADVSFDNGALEEACRVCGTSPETHATVRVDHAYQQGWRNASAN